jgi:hypothetical protein
MTLFLSGRRVGTQFDLLGQDENAMTAALGLALERSADLRSLVLRELGCPADTSREDALIKLQSWRHGHGVTDVEIVVGSSFLAIIEAKQGAWLPTLDQLQLYTPVLKQSNVSTRCLATLSDAPTAFAREALPATVDDEVLHHLTWRRLLVLVEEASRTDAGAARRVLSDLAGFLEGLLGMDTLYSNRVFVVSLGAGSPTNWPISWIDVVTKHQRYFYPVGKRWPDPPNYLGFRYGGRLQSIHHVEAYSIFRDPSEVFPSVPSEPWGPHYLLTLGPAIRPPHEVKNGSRITMSNRCWCMLDTLLTSPTISDALTETERRVEAWRAARAV